MAMSPPAGPLTPPVGAQDSQELADVIVLQPARLLPTTRLCRDGGRIRDWETTDDVCPGAIRCAQAPEQRRSLIDLLSAASVRYPKSRVRKKPPAWSSLRTMYSLPPLLTFFDVSSGSIFLGGILERSQEAQTVGLQDALVNNGAPVYARIVAREHVQVLLAHLDAHESVDEAVWVHDVESFMLAMLQGKPGRC